MENQTCPKCERVYWFKSNWDTSTYMESPCDACRLSEAEELLNAFLEAPQAVVTVECYCGGFSYAPPQKGACIMCRTRAFLECEHLPPKADEGE